MDIQDQPPERHVAESHVAESHVAERHVPEPDIAEPRSGSGDVTYPCLTPEAPGRAFPLQDYAAIGDGRSVALVAPNGAVVWWCVPGIGSPPLFDALLDPAHGGIFTLHPTEPFQAQRRYRQDSNVLETVFTTASGRVRVTESMNSTFAGRLPWCELARRMEGLEGRVAMRARLVPGTRADTVAPWLQNTQHGPVFHAGPVLGLLQCSANMHLVLEDDRTLVAEGTLAAGDTALVAVIAGEDQPLTVPQPETIEIRITQTDEAWRIWAESLRYDGPYRDAVRRSGLALKLLLYSPSGAIAAAATTSLPERIGGAKNWDYRFAWVRDASYTLVAFLRLGIIPESQAAFAWLIQRLNEGVRVCYGLEGGEVPPEHEIDVPGYRGSRPVRRGNRAGTQFQHGVYGDILLAAHSFVEACGVLDKRTAAVLADLADECADTWRRKDAGLWELVEARHYTMSKLSCWLALHLAAGLAANGHLPAARRGRWERERDRVQAWIEAHCWSEPRNAYAFYAGSDDLDAAIALAPRFGYPHRARLAATCDAIRRDLARGPWVYRYSGAELEEGAFLACSFWLAEGYAELDRLDDATAIMDATLSALPANVGILAEMVDPATGDFLGNTPQGLSHLTLIHAAVAIAEATERANSPERPER